MFEKLSLVASLTAYMAALLGHEVRLLVDAALTRQQARWSGSTPESERTLNIIVVGASFAGHQVARVLAGALPPRSPYRIVVIEPQSHFVFTWILPRCCVLPGHEHKAFIPYGGYTAAAPEGAVRWIRDRVAAVEGGSVRLQGSGEVIPYSHLVIATGSHVEHGLPSRVDEVEKGRGMELLRGMQRDIEQAGAVVVVGGGAAGVEVATDAKSLYPGKSVTLVHSRSALMHRFGKRLQDAALEGAERLGVEVVLEDRVVGRDEAARNVTLKSGRALECDALINCVGQKPSSGLVAQLSPSCITPSGHIRVKPTLQIDDDDLSNIYACGDVADTKTPNPNARSASRQADIVARNILQATRGETPSHVYEHHWADDVIKLTLALDQAVAYIGDDTTNLLFWLREREDLGAAKCWKFLGQKPFEDETKTKGGASS